MLVVSTRTLNILAALTWYIGGIVLMLKGGSLLAEAEALEPHQAWPWLAIVAGLFLGALQAKFLFSRNCRKNLERIAALSQPRIWQFFRTGFFLALVVMILTGAALSRLAHGHHPFLIGVAIVDLSLATGLLGSSYVFWKQKAFAK
jgi:hypothetical protein